MQEKKKRKEKRGYREQKGIFDHKDYQIQGKVSVELFGLALVDGWVGGMVMAKGK